ncbi:MAG: TonB-dependent receptor, partial [Pseudomonadota bacterium]
TYANTSAELTERAPGLVGPFDALAGARLPGHAEHQGSVNLIYSAQWSDYNVAFNYGVIFTSDVYNIVGGAEDPLVDATAGDAPADRGGESLPGYGVQHVSLTVGKDNWTLQAYIDNLANKYYLTGTKGSRRFLADELNGPGRDINGFTQRSYGQNVGTPLTAGVRLNYTF